MFRRKDEESDNLFGATGAAETTATTATTSSASSSSGSTSPQAPAASASAASSAPASRATLPEPRSSSAGVGAFRSATNPLAADITRSRLPETKATPATTADKGNKSARRVLTVGNDILLKGEIATCDRLVIEGKVDATLNEVHTVEIAENGSFKGAAHIEDAEISGLFEGELVVRCRLVIYATGKVRGKISYGEIEIERGGELTGEIKTTSSQAGTARPARAPKEEKSYAAA